VLKLTGDPLALGIVLALEGIPRAIFMLLGGAITDRLSPRIVMLVSDVIRLILTGVMAFVVLAGIVQMWMVVFPSHWGSAWWRGFAIPAGKQYRADAGGRAGLCKPVNSLMMGVNTTGRVRRADHCRHPDRRILPIVAGHRAGLRHRCV